MYEKPGNNLTQRIVDDLGMAIVRGEYDEQTFPTEAKLANSYVASRTVIREAVKILGGKSLITSRPKVGTRIRPEEEWNILDPDVLRWFLQRKLSIQLLQEFFEIRMQIEPAAAALAAQNADVRALAQIRKCFELMEAANKGDCDPLDADISFHIAILDASGNRFFKQLSSVTETALRFSIRVTNRKRDENLHIELHRRVCDAICARDSAAASEYASELLKVVGDILDAEPDSKSSLSQQKNS